MGRAWLENGQRLRVIQTNLQVKDTASLDPDRLADELVALGGDALVMNVGGIYAWYPTQIPHHTRNPYLPAERDLFAEIVESCHRRGILLFARLDFSKAEDSVFLRHPDWFVRDPGNKLRLVGTERPGPWPLLALTCLNAPYRNEAVAVPVLKEILGTYPVDAVFLNAPHFEPCHCERCRRRYRDVYGQSLPETDEGLPKRWADACFQRNILTQHNAMKAADPSVPLILYYGNQPAFSAEVADLLCTESQDILSRGHGRIPGRHEPTLNTKLGCSVENGRPPFGIVHASPGMAWRHTGLPEAEYRFWMSQVAANGGQLWHSLTGHPATIGDRRVLHAVAATNREVKLLQECMSGLAADSDVLLLWDGGSDADGWAGLLTSLREPFDVLPIDQATAERLGRYTIVVMPDISPSPNAAHASITLSALLDEYVRNGGALVLERALSIENEAMASLAGIADSWQPSEDLQAAYLRIEPDAGISGLDPSENALLPLAGTVLYTVPTMMLQSGETSVEILLTLVPPFSPMEAVGAPPERASLAVERTELPMLMMRELGKGRVASLFFGLGRLAACYGLADHEILAVGLLEKLRGSKPTVRIDAPSGVYLSVWQGRHSRGDEKSIQTGHDTEQQQVCRNEDRDPECRESRTVLLILMNGVGERPLKKTTRLQEIPVSLLLKHDETVLGIRTLLTGAALVWTIEENTLMFRLPALNVWEGIEVDLSTKP